MNKAAICHRQGYLCRYTWVAEIQPGRALRTGKEVVHYHLLAWLPRDVVMPKWDVARGRRLAFWPQGMSNTQRAKAGVGYLMKYLSKLVSRQAQTAGSRWPSPRIAALQPLPGLQPWQGLRLALHAAGDAISRHFAPDATLAALTPSPAPAP